MANLNWQQGQRTGDIDTDFEKYTARLHEAASVALLAKSLSGLLTQDNISITHYTQPLLFWLMFPGCVWELTTSKTNWTNIKRNSSGCRDITEPPVLGKRK